MIWLNRVIFVFFAIVVFDATERRVVLSPRCFLCYCVAVARCSCCGSCLPLLPLLPAVFRRPDGKFGVPPILYLAKPSVATPDVGPATAGIPLRAT